MSKDYGTVRRRKRPSVDPSDTMLGHVRGWVDDLMVVRVWHRYKQRWTYELLDPYDFVFGIWWFENRPALPESWDEFEPDFKGPPVTPAAT